ncbi:hypothetical protein MMC21_008243 [Puttea exsequens]|nr:hypothetical protein [Puttea exsequens]
MPCVQWPISQGSSPTAETAAFRSVVENKWQYYPGEFDPGYCRHPSEPNVRFAHPTEPEDQQPRIASLLTDGHILQCVPMCLCVEMVSTDNLHQPLRDLSSLQNCPVIDDEEYLGGLITIDEAPLNTSTPIPLFALKSTLCTSDTHPHNLGLLALSRFIDSAYTDEHLHWEEKLGSDIRLKDENAFSKIRSRCTSEQVRASGLTWKDIEFEDEEHLCTCDPRRC